MNTNINVCDFSGCLGCVTHSPKQGAKAVCRTAGSKKNQWAKLLSCYEKQMLFLSDAAGQQLLLIVLASTVPLHDKLRRNATHLARRRKVMFLCCRGQTNTI